MLRKALSVFAFVSLFAPLAQEHTDKNTERSHIFCLQKASVNVVIATEESRMILYKVGGGEIREGGELGLYITGKKWQSTNRI